MRANPRANFYTGIVVGALTAIALLFSIYWVPRKGITFARSSLDFTVVLDEAHGLHAGSPVMVSGLEAGEVTGVDIRQLGDAGWRVLVGVRVFDRGRFEPMLTTGSSYQVARSGLLGQMVLAIAPGGPGEAIAGRLVDGTPPADFTRILDDLGVVTKRVADFMDGREPGDPNLRMALQDLQAAIRNVRDFTQNLPR